MGIGQIVDFAKPKPDRLTTPKILLAPQDDRKLWHPTIIGDSDVLAGKNALLCYARLKDAMLSEREFLVRPIEFAK